MQRRAPDEHFSSEMDVRISSVLFCHGQAGLDEVCDISLFLLQYRWSIITSLAASHMYSILSPAKHGVWLFGQAVDGAVKSVSARSKSACGWLLLSLFSIVAGINLSLVQPAERWWPSRCRFSARYFTYFCVNKELTGEGESLCWYIGVVAIHPPPTKDGARLSTLA